jgi:hypothetical protein
VPFSRPALSPIEMKAQTLDETLNWLSLKINNKIVDDDFSSTLGDGGHIYRSCKRYGFIDRQQQSLAYFSTCDQNNDKDQAQMIYDTTFSSLKDLTNVTTNTHADGRSTIVLTFKNGRLSSVSDMSRKTLIKDRIQSTGT